MTEKQYDVIYEKEPRGQVVTDNGIPCTARTCCTLLNRLTEENKELKTFKDKVFDKINEYIETSDKYRTPIETIEYGYDIGYWDGVYQRMNRLKRELKE